jgi:NADP-dependent 3-hydroxy acid dehydrogenase YdfG
VITNRKIDVLKNTALELESEIGEKVLAVACDVRKYNEVENVIKETISRFG